MLAPCCQPLRHSHLKWHSLQIAMVQQALVEAVQIVRMSMEHYCAHQYTHTRPTLRSPQTYRRHPCKRPARPLPPSGFAFAECCGHSAFMLYLIMHIHCHLASTFLSCEVMFLFIEESQRHCLSNASQSFAATSRDCNYNCHPVLDFCQHVDDNMTRADNLTNVLDIGRGKRFSFDCRKWFNFLKFNFSLTIGYWRLVHKTTATTIDRLFIVDVGFRRSLWVVR